MAKSLYAWVTGVMVLAASVAMAQGQSDELHGRAKSMVGSVDTVPADQLDRPIVKLGQQLFWDERLTVK